MFTVMYSVEAAQSRRIVCVDMKHTGDGTGLDWIAWIDKEDKQASVDLLACRKQWPCA